MSQLDRFLQAQKMAHAIGAVRSLSQDALDAEIAEQEKTAAALGAGTARRQIVEHSLLMLRLARQWANQAREQLMDPAELLVLQADAAAEWAKGGAR